MSAENLPQLETMSEGMAGAQNYYDWIYNTLRPFLGQTILEIGPGYGAFAERIIRDEKTYFAVDVEDKVISRLKNSLGLDASHCITGDVTQPHLCAHFQRAKVDTILSMNVLEHIEKDIDHLRALARCAPGGRLVLFVPAMPMLYGTFDKEAGHFRRYSAKRLKEVVSAAGLTLKYHSYFNALGAVAWFVSTRILGFHMHTEGTIRSIHLYDRLAIPFLRMADPLLNHFWGQSLLAVVEIPK